MRIRPNLLHQDGMGKAQSTTIATAATVFLGLLIAYTMPRGPTTASQVAIVMVTSFAVGYGAGWIMRSPWAMVLAPLAYMLAIEVGRFPIVGPTVDGLRLNETFGILSLILGRGFHGLVGVLPMMLGAYWGWAIPSESFANVRYGAGNKIPLMQTIRAGDKCTIGAIAATLGLGISALLILLPASTPAMLDANGKPLSGSIASLEKVRLGGHDQWIMLRAHSTEKPVLLYLSGGPGQSDLPFVRVLLDDLTQNFVVVGWDQRGTGKSYSALDPTETLTLDRAVSDTIELTNYLRQRFNQKKIYLLGESWGSTLGVLAVQRQPKLYYAWIGSGQMVSQRETDRRIYQEVLALAEKTNDTTLAEKMRSYGEPPYKDMPYANAFVMGLYDRLSPPYTPPQSYIQRGTEAKLGPWGMLGSEYNFVEKVNVMRGLIDMFYVMYPQLQAVDFRQTVKRLEVPVYLLDGAAELRSRRDLVLEWFNSLQAPHKQIFTFENAGHSVVFEQFEAFSQIMQNTILPDTYRRDPLQQ
jgi:proline iminopeptidase